MMNKMCMAAIIAASLYAGTTFAQPAAVKKIIETGQTDNRVMHQLDILTNRFGGRVIGSDAYENAAEWMMREYKRWGIDVRLEEAGELPVGFNRGPWFGRLIGEIRRWICILSLHPTLQVLKVCNAGMF